MDVGEASARPVTEPPGRLRLAWAEPPDGQGITGGAVIIEVTRSDGITVVAPQGDLDLTAADELKRAIVDVIDRGETRLIIDLGGVAYIDSSGLHVLVVSMKRARASHGDVKVCGLQPDVRSIFEMTRLMKAVDVYPGRQEALAAPWR
jgi:anti-sigma B factor antagonist